MRIAEGDRPKHKLTGQLYEVKIIKDDTFILESAHTPYRMWFGEEGLESFFETTEKKRLRRCGGPQSSEGGIRPGMRSVFLFPHFELLNSQIK
jgi:hypothetical protein